MSGRVLYAPQNSPVSADSYSANRRVAYDAPRLRGPRLESMSPPSKPTTPASPTTGKPPPTYGQDVRSRGAEVAGDSSPSRRERTRRSPSPQEQQASRPVSHGFAPSSPREALIAIAAYYRAERRGFLPGHEQEDWLAAEREIDRAGKAPT